MAAFCPACGSALEPDSVFCAVCGGKVAGADMGPPQGIPPLAEAYRPSNGVHGQSFAVAASAGVGPTRQVQIAVPPWLAKDWAVPAVLGLVTPLIGTVLLYLAFSFLIVAAGIDGSNGIGSLFGIAPTLWAHYNGLPANLMMIATGLAWILVSFKASGMIAERVGRGGEVSASGRTFGAALKAAVLYATTTLLIGVIGHAILGRASLGAFGSQLGGAITGNLAATFFVGLVVGFVLSLRWLLRSSETSLFGAAGLNLDVALPPAFTDTARAAWSGAKLTLGVGVGAAAALTFVGALVTLLSDGGLVGGLARGNWFSTFTLVESAAAATWADVGAAMLVHAMRFLLGAPLHLPLDTAAHTPGWLYVGLIVPATACFTGGMRSARRREAPDVANAMISGAAIGPLVALPLFIWAALNTRILGGGMVLGALLLPLLWGGIFGAAGAFLVASREGLPGGGGFRVVVSSGAATAQPVAYPPAYTPSPAAAPAAVTQTATPTASEPAFCERCGAQWRPGNRFCHSCGTASASPEPAPAAPPSTAPAPPPPSSVQAPVAPVATPPPDTATVPTPVAAGADTGATLMVIRCPSCNLVAADDDAFCASCGHAIARG